MKLDLIICILLVHFTHNRLRPFACHQLLTRNACSNTTAVMRSLISWQISPHYIVCGSSCNYGVCNYSGESRTVSCFIQMVLWDSDILTASREVLQHFPLEIHRVLVNCTRIVRAYAHYVFFICI